MSKSLVSVIIPMFNASKWIEKTLYSCLNQSGNFELEIIIVDDHSSDNCFEIVHNLEQKFPEIISLYRNKEKGANHARNFGFEKASGQYIQWLDSDDLILEGKFEAQVEYLESQPSIDIVYSDWRLDTYQNNDKISEEKKIEKQYDSFLSELLKNNWKPLHSYLIRYKVAEELFNISAWSPKRKIGQDREYVTKAAILGANFFYLKGCFCVYNKWNNQSISNHLNFKQNIRNSLELNQELYKMIKNTCKVPRPYYNILNAEILNALFYYPTIDIPRLVLPFRWNTSHWDIKKRLALPILYVWQFFRINKRKYQLH